MKHTQLFLLILISSFVIFSCKKDESNEKPKEDIPIKIALLTKDVNNITKNSAESGVTIQVTGTGFIDEVGICWSTNQLPTVKDKFVSGSESSEYSNTSKSFDLNILGLDSNTTFFVRSYAKYKDSVYYGNELTFKTLNGAVEKTQFWILGDIINTDSLNYTAYEEEEQNAIFIDKYINTGVIKFNSGLQAPLEYTVVSNSDSLLVQQAYIEVFYNVQDLEKWGSLSGGAKIKTSLENGKIKVEFENVQMKSEKDGRIVNSSASFYLEQ